MSEANTLKAKIRDGIITDFDINAPFPKEFQLDITDICNQRCIFCSNYKRKVKRHIDHELAQKALLEAYELGARRVGLYGTGEPLLNRNLAYYTAYAKKLGYEYCYIDTNGALATADRIIPIIQAGLDSIKFSISAGCRDTYMEVHGRDDFDIVIDNLKLLWEYRKKTQYPFHIYVSMAVMDKTKTEANLLEKIISPYIDEWYVRTIFNTCGNNPENNELAKIEPFHIRGRSKNKICFQPFNGFTVTPEGLVSACVLDYQRVLILGDLTKSTLKEIWESELYRDFRKKHKQMQTKGLICYNCIHNTNERFEPILPQYAAIFVKDWGIDPDNN